MNITYMRVIGTVIPLRERIRRAWKALHTKIEPEDYDSGGWTSSSTTEWVTSDELAEFPPGARESIMRGLSQRATIDRGSFAQYAAEEPNDETKAAIREAETGEGCHYFDSLDDLYRDLEEP